jgi:hypothetical protein
MEEHGRQVLESGRYVCNIAKLGRSKQRPYRVSFRAASLTDRWSPADRRE